MKIYVASPLFTAEEKKVINEVAAVLHRAGYETYLPMEHAVSDAWSYTNEEWADKMFTLDKEAIDNCDAVLCIYYGMNSDSGTSWEVGYAYGKEKQFIFYLHQNSEIEVGILMICNGASANTIFMSQIPNVIESLTNDCLPYQS